MSMQNQEAIARSIKADLSFGSGTIAEALLRRIVGELECGELVIETPAGHRLTFVGLRAGPQAKVAIRRWRCLWRLVSNSDIGFAEGYIAGEWSSPNLTDLLILASLNASMAEPLKAFQTPRFWLKLRHAMNRNSRKGSRRNIAAHYDLGNDFYQHWLDAGMSYSAGLFSHPSPYLEEAQDAKLDRVIEMLALTGGEEVLEIGCGWGSFAERLLRRHDCSITGITLSEQQLLFAQNRLQKGGLDRRADLRLQDYRDVSGTYDRIVSIEMLEAVGEAYWPTYFEKLHDSLRPGGVAVLQVITIDEDRYNNYRRRPDFIQKYIFPGGMLPTQQIIERESTKAGLRFAAGETFSEGYARTLEEWRLRFQEAWHSIKKLGFDDRFKNMWEYYLAYCQAGFETAAINVGLYKLERPCADVTRNDRAFTRPPNAQ